MSLVPDLHQQRPCLLAQSRITGREGGIGVIPEKEDAGIRDFAGQEIGVFEPEFWAVFGIGGPSRLRIVAATERIKSMNRDDAGCLSMVHTKNHDNLLQTRIHTLFLGINNYFKKIS